MKTILRFVLTAAFLTLPPGSEAALWSSVISNGKMRAEIDLASFLRQGNIVTAWDRDVYSAMEQARPGDFYFKSAKSLMRYNCDARTADLLMKVYYAEDGSEIATITASYYGKPNYVIPDTHDEQKFDYACKYRKAPEKAAAAAVVGKKDGKSKETGKAAAPALKTTLKEAPAADAKPSPVAPPITPPRSLPIRKPSALLPKP